MFHVKHYLGRFWEITNTVLYYWCFDKKQKVLAPYTDLL